MIVVYFFSKTFVDNGEGDKCLVKNSVNGCT